LEKSNPQARTALRLNEKGIGVYSPHTALDAAPGGVCDWLGEGLGELASSRAITSVDPDARTPVGAGRLVTLADPAPLDILVSRIKAHLALAQVRLASAPAHEGGRPVREVALCPGAGGGLFAPLHGPDLYLTGEMRHHDVLAKVAAGASVVLTDHTNCERGYLLVLARAMRSALPNLHVDVAADDRDPLRIV
jgi:putative NIF3 family GTP cyclohydrolase 1 type 2